MKLRKSSGDGSSRRLMISRACETISDFVDYSDRESILPPGAETSEYRKRFEAAYPFQPDVIDVLYQRLGKFP